MTSSAMPLRIVPPQYIPTELEIQEGLAQARAGYKETLKKEQEEAQKAYPHLSPNDALKKYTFRPYVFIPEQHWERVRYTNSLSWKEFSFCGLLIQRNASNIFDHREGFWKDYGFTIKKKFTHLPTEAGFIEERRNWESKKILIITTTVILTLGLAVIAIGIYYKMNEEN